MNHDPEQLKESYQKLPEAVKEALFAVETAEKIMGIGEKHKLHIDQIGALADETGLVMLGLNPHYQFVEHVKEKLNIDQQTAENIASDVNNEIFLPVREALKQNQDQAEQPPKPVPDTFFEQKMSKMFNLPKEEKKIDPYLEPPI